MLSIYTIFAIENQKPTAIKTKAPQQVIAESEHKQKREMLKSAGLLERQTKIAHQDQLAEKVETARANTSEPKLRNRVNEEVSSFISTFIRRGRDCHLVRRFLNMCE